jgi:hypothetical protein
LECGSLLPLFWRELARALEFLHASNHDALKGHHAVAGQRPRMSAPPTDRPCRGRTRGSGGVAPLVRNRFSSTPLGSRRGNASFRGRCPRLLYGSPAGMHSVSSILGVQQKIWDMLGPWGEGRCRNFGVRACSRVTGCTVSKPAGPRAAASCRTPKSDCIQRLIQGIVLRVIRASRRLM